MIRACRHLKALTIVLILVLFCLPLTGDVYFTTYLSTSEASDAGLICDHNGADSGHESNNGPKMITHCHELDAPYDTASGPFLGHFPIVSMLASTYLGAMLPGYEVPIDIPPENPV